MKLITKGHECKSCHRIHNKVPKDFKPWINPNGSLMGYDFKCACGSNMFVTPEKVKAA